jgi:phage I-like protein
MKIFDALGAKDEAGALAIVEQYNKFSDDISALTGQTESGAIMGTLAAWKARADSGGSDKAAEETHVDAAIAGFTGPKAGLKEAFASGGVVGFYAKLDERRAEVKAAADKIDGLVSSGRLKPAARDTFEKLYASHGLTALDAAAQALPEASAAPLATHAPVGKPSGSGDGTNAIGLTADELAICKASGKSPELFAKQKADQAKDSLVI